LTIPVFPEQLLCVYGLEACKIVEVGIRRRRRRRRRMGNVVISADLQTLTK